jgi:L-threonylcarbamoyladenylate synthase
MKTEIIKSKDRKSIASAVAVLKRNGIVIYPTETSYGVGADATNIRALKKINRLKGRKGKFIPIIISDIKMTEKYFVLNSDMKKLMKRFMPGPLTLVAKKKMKTKKLIGGFRIPSNRFALKLVKKFGKPVTATSANLSGDKPIYKISDIKKLFSGRVDLIIDAGNLKRRKPSTVFDVTNMKIIRKGKINKKEINKVLG